MKRLSQPIRSFRCTWLIEYWRETVVTCQPTLVLKVLSPGSEVDTLTGTSIKCFFPFFFFPFHNIANFSVWGCLQNILFRKDSDILNYSPLGHTRARIMLTWSIFVWIYRSHVPNSFQMWPTKLGIARKVRKKVKKNRALKICPYRNACYVNKEAVVLSMWPDPAQLESLARA